MTLLLLLLPLDGDACLALHQTAAAEKESKSTAGGRGDKGLASSPHWVGRWCRGASAGASGGGWASGGQRTVFEMLIKLSQAAQASGPPGMQAHRRVAFQERDMLSVSKLPLAKCPLVPCLLAPVAPVAPVCASLPLSGFPGVEIP